MASIQMNRGTKAEIDNTPITDGLISFDTDDNYIYLDNGDSREPFGGVKVIPNPEEQPTEILRNLQIAEDVYKISGGHEIENQSGTVLTQRDTMQFTGAYSHDDSTNETTKIDIVREMTASQKDSLTNGEAEGFQWTTDENDDLPLTAEWVAYDSDTSVKEKIDEIDLTSGGTIDGNLIIDHQNANSVLRLGNSTNSVGHTILFSNNDKYIDLTTESNLTANRVIGLPDKTGTLAVIGDITSGNFSAGSNITIGSRNFWRKEGNFVFATVVLSVTANLSADAVLLSNNELNFVNNSYLYARNEDGSIRILTCAGHNIYTEFAIPSGTVLRIGQVMFTQ